MAETSDEISAKAARMVNQNPFADQHKMASIVARLQAAGWNTRSSPVNAATELRTILEHEFRIYLTDVRSVAASAWRQDETKGERGGEPNMVEAAALAGQTVAVIAVSAPVAENPPLGTVRTEDGAIYTTSGWLKHGFAWITEEQREAAALGGWFPTGAKARFMSIDTIEVRRKA